MRRLFHRGGPKRLQPLRRVGIRLAAKEAEPELFAYLKGLADRSQANASDAHISCFCLKVLAARGSNLDRNPEFHAMARQRCRGGFAGAAPAQRNLMFVKFPAERSPGHS